MEIEFDYRNLQNVICVLWELGTNTLVQVHWHNAWIAQKENTENLMVRTRQRCVLNAPEADGATGRESPRPKNVRNALWANGVTRAA